MRWICSQIGAREHYAIPRILHQSAKLEYFYTDFWASPLWQHVGNLVGRPQLTARFHPSLSSARVESYNLTRLVDSVFGGGQQKNPYDWFLYVGRDFGRSVVESLRGKKYVKWSETVFFGYDTGFLEPANWVKTRGGKTVVCQMDPSRFEFDLVKDEEKRWPGWARKPIDVHDAYFSRREEEWAAANVVMVNSEWSKQALITQGVSEEKIVVVPLAYEADQLRVVTQGLIDGVQKNSGFSSLVSGFSQKNPLRVLFLGQVILRKGIQYLIEAARLLQNEPVRFDVVGPIGISEEAKNAAPNNMRFHGAIRRDQAEEFYRDADLFILPTLSDGFALTQIEAMAYGLPVITTPNCGAVVTSGIDGVVVESRNAVAIEESIKGLLQNPTCLRAMSEKALLKSADFDLLRLSENLKSLELRLEKTTVFRE